MSDFPWIDYERMPTLDDESSYRLKRLIDQPYAPIFRNRSGHHLQDTEVKALEKYRQKEADMKVSANFTENDWLDGFINDCFKQVPFYRQYVKNYCSFLDIPTVTRAELSKDITQFIPDNLPIERLIAYETSGTTGHPLLIPSHPTVAARYSCYHKKALAWNGVNIEDFQSELAVMLAGYQEECFTYASVSPYLNNKGLVKLNFHPSDWNDPDDRQKYLDFNKPDLISGDPISLIELTKLPFSYRPKAVFTTSMTLMEACKIQMQKRFDCPVIDLYSLNETGPIGCSIPDNQGFKLLQSRLLVEILNAHGLPVQPGQSGEITVTGGFNDYLPLLRYRTGDFGRLKTDGNDWIITELEGRLPIQFKTQDNQWLNNIDVTHLLQQFPLSQFSLHQHHDGRFTMRILPATYADQVQKVLNENFGFPVVIKTIDHISSERKIIQYTSDLRRPY